MPPDRGDIPQPKLVLDLATPEGCKAEMAGYTPRMYSLIYKISTTLLYGMLLDHQ